jgi:hypothetical protein
LIRAVAVIPTTELACLKSTQSGRTAQLAKGPLGADIVEKLEFFAPITIQKTAGSLDGKFLRGSAERPIFLRTALS